MRPAPFLAAWLSLLIAASLPPATSAQAPEPARVETFSPQGTVKGVRQVSARFSDPMIAIGDPRATSSPFVIACPPKGTGRWADAKLWVYDFEADLPAGIRCTFRVREGFTTLGGRRVQAERPFVFDTGGPAIDHAWPYEGSEIQEDQAFALMLDAPATAESVLAHVAFAVPGLTEPVGVRIVTGAARAAILKALPDEPERPADRKLIVQARRPFPNGAKVKLVWGKGVAARSGVRTTQAQVLPYQVRPPFAARFYCEREHARAGCVPVSKMSVIFTSEIPLETARRIRLVGPEKSWTPKPPARNARAVASVEFVGPFPEETGFRVDIPAGITDDAGRPLVNADKFPLAVKTAAYPPLAKFPTRFSIVEAKAQPALPITVRGLEPEVKARILGTAKPGTAARVEDLLGQATGRVWRIGPDRMAEIIPWLRKVAVARRERSIFEKPPANAAIGTFTLPRPGPGRVTEVIGIPFKAPGFYVVEVSSARLGAQLLGKPGTLHVPAVALVTNLSVHLKWGRENSLAWVTTLDRARPVEGAQVEVRDCRGKVLWEGVTDRAGIARPPGGSRTDLIEGLPARDALPRCPHPAFTSTNPIHALDWDQTPALRNLEEGIYVTARKAGDLSFAHSSWDSGIEPWRFELPSEDYQAPIAAHTIFDRTLLRAGETVRMKHVMRAQALGGFAPVPAKERPRRVVIEHAGSGEKFEFPLALDAWGIAETAWPIPKEAKLGEYTVQLVRPPAERKGASSGNEAAVGLQDYGRSWVSGHFRVEEFRVPLMRGTVQLPPGPHVNPPSVPVTVAVRYLAGGSAAELPVILRAQITPGLPPRFEAFEDFQFANGGVQPGIVRRALYDGEGEADAKPPVHQRTPLVLDRDGTARAVIARIPPADTPRALLAEIEFRDPNGESQTVAASVPLWPARRLVGVKPDSWMSGRDTLKAHVAVVDVTGRPQAGVPVRVELYERAIYSNRQRLVGGFYAYEHVEEVRPRGELCRGVTDARGLLHCEGKPPASGDIVLQAVAADETGRPATAHADVWVPGEDEWWFDVEDSDRIDLLPEKRRYEPGEKARLQVRMPFRSATALVTAEREGMLEAFVVKLSGREPVIEVPVRGGYAPNVFVSALVVRGRASGVKPTALIDLGRPAFKLGITELRVGWRAHELEVRVTTPRAAYQVRQKATVRIAVRTADGKAPPPGSEVAVAAVDEGLLELAPNESWKLLDAMMGRRNYAVRTATAQMQVVGKRHYGKKALPLGGGGGRQATRELFDTLLLWEGRVRLDERGDAALEIPLNDSLTSFRIVAVATGGLDRFGTGSTEIRSTQDLMILPGVPPLVREGDAFRAEFTLRNTTGRALTIDARATATGLGAPLPPRRVTLAANAATTVGWDVAVPAGADEIRYEVEASAAGGPRDRVAVTQRVAPAVPVRTYQATLFQLDKEKRETVERPADALPGRGGIRVRLRPKLAEGMAGVRDWMRAYPYTCLEQRVSRAVALEDKALWREIEAGFPASLDSDGLLKYFPTLVAGSEVLTAYVLAIAHEAGLPITPETREKMLNGLAGFVNGTILRRSELPTADLAIRKIAALEALARQGKFDPKLLGSVSIDPNLWPTSAVIDWWSLLRREPAIPDRDARLAEAEQIVRSRLTYQGTVLGFSTERTDGLWWLMVSPDSNALRLILNLLDGKLWREDVPRLVSGAVARQRNAAWDLTTSNAWGVLAMRKFSAAYETTAVTGATTAALEDQKKTLDWSAKPSGDDLAFGWPERRAEIAVTHAGAGRPWVTLQASAAIPLRAPLSSGYRIRRTIEAVERKVPGRWSRGDILRVRLTIDAQSDMTWVVVNDPVPGGAGHLGTGLARDSRIAAAQVSAQESARETREEPRVWPAFVEQGFEAIRAYYDYLPKGEFRLAYTIRLNQAGTFHLPPTRVEALYAPEAFGELPNAAIEVAP